MDNSVYLIVIYITGLLGLCTAVRDIVKLDFDIYIFLCIFTSIFSLILWYIYFFKRKIFIYFTAILCAVGSAIIIPQIFAFSRQVAFYYQYGLNFSNLNISTFLIFILVTLVIFLIFAIEFVLRNHSIMFLLSAAAIALGPVAGYEVSAAAVIMTALFQFGFIAVNMTQRRIRDSFRMNTRARISTLCCICVAALILAALVPALPIENINEEDLYSTVYNADGFIKDEISKLTGNFGDNISGGKVARGNLHQTGQSMLYIRMDKKPNTQLYLWGFRGGYYENGEWSDAFAYDDGSYSYNLSEPFMSNFYTGYGNYYRYRDYEYEDDNDYANWYEDEEWFNYYSSDIVSNIYFQLGYKDKYDIFLVSKKTDLSTIEIKDMAPDYNISFYLPYYAQKSKGDFFSEWEQIYPTQTFTNSFFPIGAIDMSDKWEKNPKAERFVNIYEQYAKTYYTMLASEGNERLETLCKDTPLKTLDEITTFILYTLQTHATYSTTPGTAPFNKDIVDYFLFDNGKGYCVHFASAAALMYRMYGIPARYVTGFSVNPDSFIEVATSDTQSEYRAEVLDYSAHAWVEIFIKDYGWVPVDVTPTTSGEMITTYPGYDHEVMERVMKEHDWHFRNYSSSSSGGTTFGGGDDYEESNKLFVYIAFGIILLGIITFFPIRRKIKLNKIHTMDSRQLFDLIIKAIHFCGIMKDYNGSEKDFAQQLCKNISVISADQADEFINIMLKVNYSEYVRNKEDDESIRSLYLRLSSHLYSELQWYKKPIYKLIKALI